ncbi:LPS-assembly protein LptD [Afipia massiliensis]|uniref:LPS-assembly protein LptD n=1 Tax=Afipia massiliensis TaxID=211460 RepID=UPI000AA8C2FD
MAVVAALQGRTPAFRRRIRLRRQSLVMSAVLGLGLAAGFGNAGVTPASAQQSFRYNPQPPKPPKQKPAQQANDGQMLVQAAEVNYDYNNSRVSAVGSVQIYYNGSTLEADKVIYDQKTKRLHAEGNVRLTDPDGKITYANLLDLSDDYRDGFVDSLRLDTADQTRMAATRADRTGGEVTIFQNGVYTACAACKDNPKKPPLWQVKGARIIHNQTEKMLYFEDARLEFFGQPIAYLPFFSTPDPTVKRKSGFLIPNYSSSTRYGVGIEVPYYFALAPDYDATVSPRYTTKQGLLLQGEFRQRLINGAYEIRGYGIRQNDQKQFNGEPGDREFRGGIDTKGQFALNDKWVWGWDAVAVSDKSFFFDYGLGPYKNALNAFLLTPDTGLSQIYLTGVGNRSYFDARVMHFLGYSAADDQSTIPIVHPVIDYSNVLNRNVLGGEFSYKANFTSLSRQTASFDAINPTAFAAGYCLPTSADPLARTRSQCLLRGIPGDYTRLTAEVEWRRSFTDSIGQIFTPFASLRGDVISANIDNQPGVSNYLPIGSTQTARLMPTVGLEYRYPFINVQPWGTTTIEPIGQLIIRPNEPSAGRLPNEDAQSFTFDDSNLFRVDKFSGYDRVEGGGRANVGVQATTQFDRGGFVNVLFGQSYQLFGLNSFAVQDPTNTGIGSGLETARSDYVARIAYQPNRIYSLIARTRLDEATGTVRRFELEGRASFDRFGVSLLYGNYDAQPELGFLTRREGVVATGSIKVATNWMLSGALRYDIANQTVNQYIVGAGYVDDCFIIAANYITDYAYTSKSYTSPVTDHRIMLQIGLRTIGGTSFSAAQ